MSARLPNLGHTHIQLQVAQRASLAQTVLDQLLARIRDGSIRPGNRLPGEYELMRQLKVGRSSVREALRGLITMGLVETKTGRGAIVRTNVPNPFEHLQARRLSIEQLQKWAILDLLEVRESLEGQAAQLAAERATPTEVAAIARCAREIEKQIAEGRTYFRANSQFHFAVARASHNSVLSESVRHLIGEVRLYRERLMRELPGMRDRDVSEHRAILKAIQDRDPKRARRVMIQHLRSFAEVVRNLNAGSPHGRRDGKLTGGDPARQPLGLSSRSARGDSASPRSEGKKVFTGSPERTSCNRVNPDHSPGRTSGRGRADGR